MRIEPPILSSEENHQILWGHSFRSSRHTNQPRNTILIDLRPDLEEILGQMRQKTRQYIRRAAKEGITVRIGDVHDLPSAIELMKMTGRREHFPVRSQKYYENEFGTFAPNGECTLLLALQNDKLLAARTIYYFGRYAAEFHAGSSDGIDHLHPNYGLVWEAIKLAKSKGCMAYDLWGIPDEIDNNVEQNESAFLERKGGLWGVYRFKSGFSKNVVSYIGAYDFVYAAFPYTFMSIPFIDREKIEQIAAWADFSKSG